MRVERVGVDRVRDRLKQVKSAKEVTVKNFGKDS